MPHSDSDDAARAIGTAAYNGVLTLVAVLYEAGQLDDGALQLLTKAMTHALDDPSVRDRADVAFARRTLEEFMAARLANRAPDAD